MKTVIVLLSCFFMSIPSVCFAQSEGVIGELSAHQKEIVRLRVRQLIERDQQFRFYLAAGTLNEKKIEQYRNLKIDQVLTWRSENKDELSNEQRKLLMELSFRNDRRNHEELFKIIEKFGYPSVKRIGVKTDLAFPILLHPPYDPEEIEEYLKKTSVILKKEVVENRFSARKFAMFVDNIRGKILKVPQLYGTNQVFNPKTMKVEPPIIEDLAKTNKARKEIGLPELVDGQYQLKKHSK